MLLNFVMHKEFIYWFDESLSLVATAAASAHTASSTGLLTREPDVLSLPRTQWVTIRLHRVIGKVLALPRLYIGTTRARKNQA
jgi:hypothetical protein